jgi:hypothetical protein
MSVDIVKETTNRYLIVKDKRIRGDVCFVAGKWQVNIIGVSKLTYKHNSQSRCFGYAQGVFAAADVIGVEMYGDNPSTK